MRSESRAFFQELLEAAGPSGDERQPARAWRAYAHSFAEVSHDALGSSYATVNPEGSPSLAIFGHIDEIGLVINFIDDEGFLWFGRVGGWDPEVLVGQRVRILTADGPVPGIVGKKARHMQSPEERAKASQLDTLWIDVGATDGDDARSRVHVGDLVIVEQPVVELSAKRLVSRACDNRCGAYIAAEAVRLYAESPGTARVTGVATVAEETTLGGGHTSGYTAAPDVALAVDVTNCTDHPTTSKQKGGAVGLGKGPSLSRGAGIHPVVFEQLVEAAEAEGIAYQVEPAGGETGTDADAVILSRGGVPVGVVSVPLRYMHSPNEQLDLDDLEACVRLVAAFARRLTQAPIAE